MSKSSKKSGNLPIRPRTVAETTGDDSNNVLGEKLRAALMEHALRDDTLIARGSWRK